MTTSIAIRPAVVPDAADILAARYTAVHETAKGHYPAAILAQWSKPADPARIQRMEAVITAGHEKMQVAVVDGRVRGYGSIVPDGNCLKAIYVHAHYGRRGLGSALLAAVEQQARDLGLTYLEMAASVNAEAFYFRNGYRSLSYGVFRKASGDDMACVMMKKMFI